MNRTGRSELAIYIRISAFQTFLAKINIVFHTDVTGFSIRVIDTFTHF
jgi:hypothetical protein